MNLSEVLWQETYWYYKTFQSFIEAGYFFLWYHKFFSPPVLLSQNSEKKEVLWDDGKLESTKAQKLYFHYLQNWYSAKKLECN